MMSRTVTLIVHGTFAADAGWWRLGSEGEATFADRLEDELSRRGLSGTVWKPVLAEGLDYSSFAWSGRNRHRDRLKGARDLSSSINRLAGRVAATTSEPLIVNLVAHSHGGNVVLEALRRLKPNVRVGRIALLGTPLVTAKPAFRAARFVFSTVLLALFFLLLSLLVVQLGALLFTGRFVGLPPEYGAGGQLVSEAVSAGTLLATFFLVLLAYGWMLWLFGILLDVVWRALFWLFQPLAWLRGKASSLVYGPSPRKLATILGGQPILMLTSRNDEAGLLLEVGSAPARLYREYVMTGFSKVGRLLELAFLRPFVLGALLSSAEVLLEVVSLGFPLWRSLVFDPEVAPLEEQPYYPSRLLVRQEIDVLPRTDPAMARRDAEAGRGDTEPSAAGPPPGLRLSLQEVAEEIKRQVRLRHSSYDENQAVIHRVAGFLAGEEVDPVGESRPSSSVKPPGNFWEALLIGNVGLAAFETWIAGEALDLFLAVLVAAYVIPFAAFGITLAFYRAVRRRLPIRLWRWFWVIWAVWGLLSLLLALAAGLDHSGL